MKPNVATTGDARRGRANSSCFSDSHSFYVLNYLGFFCVHMYVYASRLLRIFYNLLPITPHVFILPPYLDVRRHVARGVLFLRILLTCLLKVINF